MEAASLSARGRCLTGDAEGVGMVITSEKRSNPLLLDGREVSARGLRVGGLEVES